MRLACDLPFARHGAADRPILTPNRLLSGVLASQYTLDRIRDGQRSWERPSILTVGAWLTSQWQARRHAGEPVPNLLSPLQEQALWKQLIEIAHPTMFNHASAARLAVNAERQISEWRIPLEHEAWQSYGDASQFRILLEEHRRRCRERDAITRSQLWRLATPGPVLLAGFEQLSPALMALAGEVCPSLMTERGKPVPAYRHLSLADEVEQAARWARGQVEKNPHASVGVVMVDLHAHRLLVQQMFDGIFYPSGSVSHSAFHLHSTVNLAARPSIAAALLLLQLGHADLAIDDASAILRCPYLGGAREEASVRALADLDLRRNRQARVTLSELVYRTRSCQGLEAIWHRVKRARAGQKPVDTLTAWSGHMAALLSATGFEGDTELEDALSELGSLTYVLAPVGYPEALRALQQLLESKEDAADGDLLSPVQIMDARDARGVRFDAAVVVNLSDGQWPQPEPANPFLPAPLRRLAGMPGSTAASVIDLRARRTRSLLSCADHVIATYTEQPAPLARPLLKASARTPAMYPGLLPQSSFRAEVLERFPDEQAPPVSSGAVATGGTRLIAFQCDCPFKAFATFRLSLDSPECASFGFDARERGNLLHTALQHVWRALENSERLQSLAPDELKQVIDAAVETAVPERDSEAFHQLMRSTERIRLAQVLREWLDIERSRRVPFRVELIEEKRSIDIAGLTLNVRVDRMDRLPDGSLLLIDYKSGMAKAADLLGDRPKQPQLLVYAAAMAAGESVDGVYLAQLKPREMKALGMATQEHFGKGHGKANAADWATERQTILERLSVIINEYLRGDAAVAPRPGACEFCDVKPLCRIAEAGVSDDNSGDE